MSVSRDFIITHSVQQQQAEKAAEDSTPRDGTKMAQEGCSLVSGGDEAVTRAARLTSRET
jgi:hypothetical protein